MSNPTRIRLQQAKEFIRSQSGGMIAPLPISEEEINPQVQDDLVYQTLPLEPKTQPYPVDFDFPKDSQCSEFRYFEDGRQRTINIGHIATTVNNRSVIVPIHFFAVGAVILQRDERRQLKLWAEAVIRAGIVVERSLVPDQRLIQQFERDGLEIVDLTAIGADYSELRVKALQKVKDLRLEAETKLIGQWRTQTNSDNDFLIVDGTLMNFRNEENVERCVGVSKSFGSRYFEVADHNRILQMKQFERSWTFRFHDEDEDTSRGARERVSWYLRLRSAYNSHPEFGLIRVEISQRHMKNASKYANRISRSLLSERLPTAYPSPRWDKHLYPIQACEDYLSSVLPSTSTIVATMKG